MYFIITTTTPTTISIGTAAAFKHKSVATFPALSTQSEATVPALATVLSAITPEYYVLIFISQL